MHRSKLAEVATAVHSGRCSDVLQSDVCREIAKVRDELIDALKRTYFWTRHYIVSGDRVLIVYGVGFNEVGLELKRLDDALDGYAPPHHRNPQPMLYGVDVWHFGGRAYEVLDADSFRAMLAELRRWLAAAGGVAAPSREVRVAVLSKINALVAQSRRGLRV